VFAWTWYVLRHGPTRWLPQEPFERRNPTYVPGPLPQARGRLRREQRFPKFRATLAGLSLLLLLSVWPQAETQGTAELCQAFCWLATNNPRTENNGSYRKCHSSIH